MASALSSRRAPPPTASVLSSLESYGSSSDESEQDSSDESTDESTGETVYITASPHSTDYDGSDIDELVSAMSQVTTEETETGRLGK